MMKIESRTVPGQSLFHAVDETWNQNGYAFSFFPHVDAEARAMMMSLIPFLRHHYHKRITKWFSQTAQSRAAGAAWDPEKGCVKIFEDDAVSWMMTEDSSPCSMRLLSILLLSPHAPTPPISRSLALISSRTKTRLALHYASWEDSRYSKGERTMKVKVKSCCQCEE
jgi:hypothetical protein